MTDRLRIAIPCSERWDSMEGPGRLRMCKPCGKPVLDVGSLTTAEVDSLLASGAPLPCLWLARTAKGKPVTAHDRAGKRRVVLRVLAAAAAVTLSLPAHAEAEDAPETSASDPTAYDVHVPPSAPPSEEAGESPEGLAPTAGGSPDFASEPERTARGMVYGFELLGLVSLTPQTNTDTPEQPAFLPGWLGLGRIGFELDGGWMLSFLAGGGGAAASIGGASLLLRGLAEVRWTVPTGGSIRPYFGLAGGYTILRARTNLRSNVSGVARGGLDVIVADWASLDLGVWFETIAPIEGLRDPWLLAGLDFGVTFTL